MSKPTVVLVHGAFADASIWRPVFELLDADEYPVLAPPNPLRGVASDAAYIQTIIDQIDGSVVLVGHSYGAAVVTVAGASEKVAAVVYVAGLVPDEGESVSDLQSRYPALAMARCSSSECFPTAVSRYRSTHNSSTPCSAPTCPTLMPRSSRTLSVHCWPPRSTNRPRRLPSKPNRRGRCSALRTARSLPRCTAFNTAAPVPRLRKSKTPHIS